MATAAAESRALKAKISELRSEVRKLKHALFRAGKVGVDEELQKAIRDGDWDTVKKIAIRNGAKVETPVVEHRLTGFTECSLFNSSKEYSWGYDFANCSCGWQSPPGKRRDLPGIFELHAKGLA